MKFEKYSNFFFNRLRMEVRELAFHKCRLGFNTICRLHLLILFSALTGFSLSTALSPALQKPKLHLI